MSNHVIPRLSIVFVFVIGDGQYDILLTSLFLFVCPADHFFLNDGSPVHPYTSNVIEPTPSEVDHLDSHFSPTLTVKPRSLQIKSDLEVLLYPSSTLQLSLSKNVEVLVPSFLNESPRI